MNAYERVLAALEQHGRKVRRNGDQASAQCPAHDDRNPSLSVTRGDDQALLLCHGDKGCTTDDVVAALGLTLADLFDNPRGSKYDYVDLSGSVTRSVFRSPDKKFRQTGDTKKRILYNLPAVVEAAKDGQTIYLVEGEKDVHTMKKLDVVATTGPQGANSIGKVDFLPLAGAKVVAVVDKDDAGKKWAETVADKLGGIAAEIRFVEALHGKDATDHIVGGGTLDNFVDLDVEIAPREQLPRLWKATDLAGVQQPAWLARQRLPRSAVTILVGDEGIRKSLLWVWIVAAVTTGKPLDEFGIPERDPEDVFLVVTEDEWSFTVRPRLEVAGADLSRISVICAEKDGSGSPVFPRDMVLITTAPTKPSLIVVDAFLDTVPGNLQMKDPQQARQALHPWKEVATRTGAAIMLLTHTNRVDSAKARDKYGITGELRKKARMTLFAQQDDDGFLVVGPEKSNIVGKVLASKFTIQPVKKFEPTIDHDGTVPLLSWVGESSLTASDHIEETYSSQHGEDANDRSAAADWLEDYLTEQGGSAASKDVKKKAKAEGISDRSIKRAAKTLGVKVTSEGFPRTTVWTLPQWGQSGHDEARPSEPGPTGPTGSDLGKRHGPTEQSGQSGHPENDGPTVVPTESVKCGICSQEITGEKAGPGQSRCIGCGQRVADEGRWSA